MRCATSRPGFERLLWHPKAPSGTCIHAAYRTGVETAAGSCIKADKHYIVGEDGTGGAFYIWPAKEAAQHGHDAELFANIKARTGSVPTIR